MLSNQVSKIKSSEEFEDQSRNFKRSSFEIHQNYKKRHTHKSKRKSHHHARRTKSKSKHRKRNNHHQNSNKIESSFDTRSMIQDHLYISIVGFLCFFPTGIIGLIRAMHAYEMKRSTSLLYWPKLAAIYGRHALRWSILSILIGTILWISFIIYRLLRQQRSLW